jgi:hypothetical protein
MNFADNGLARREGDGCEADSWQHARCEQALIYASGGTDERVQADRRK